MSTLEQIKSLRELTGAGVVDVKKALDEAKGDEKKAIDILRKKGQSKAVKKADRTALEGVIGYYIHSNRKIGAMVKVMCETDFVARTEEFRTLGHEIAMQIAASNPSYIRREDVPAEVAEHEAEVIKAQAREEGKPEKMLDKIAEGRLNKFYEENCLLEQRYIRDPDKKINDLIIENIAKMGENIVVRRFARFMIES